MGSAHEGRLRRGPTPVGLPPDAARSGAPAAEPAPIRPVPVPGLTVGSADDHAESRADSAAETALARLRRRTVTVGEPGPAARPAPTSGVDVAGGALDVGTSGRIEQRLGTGAPPLAPDVRQRMETAFGTSLGAVRVHDDADAARLAVAVSAHAFTVGRDIFLGAAGQDEAVLAHELAHVVGEPGDPQVRRLVVVTRYRGEKHTNIGDAKRARDVFREHTKKQYDHLADDDFAKAFAIMDDASLSEAARTFADREAYAQAMLTHLTTVVGPRLNLGVPVGPTPQQLPARVVVVERPTGVTGPMLLAAVSDSGPDLSPVDITRAELFTLSQDRTAPLLVRYVADHAFGLLREADPSNKKATPLTLAMVRLGQKAYDDDKTIDKSPELPPTSPEARALATEFLRAAVPTIAANDKGTFAELDDLLTNRIRTELTQALARELEVAMRLLDSRWMLIKPKARDALREMISRTSEFGGLRGVIGEAAAAWYATAMGRTEVSVGNDKRFEPDALLAGKPRAGIDFQDVDVASNTPTERFYTEAKYDMGTFLSKASETVAEAEQRAEDAEKKSQERLAAQRLAKSSTTGGPSVITTSAPSKRPPRTIGPEKDYPAQLHRYEKAAGRTKAKGVKQPRSKRLEIYIANGHDWLWLFVTHKKVLDHLKDKNWRVVVETHEVMAVADECQQRFLALRKETLDEHKRVSKEHLNLDPWVDELSAAVRPAEFVSLSFDELRKRSNEALTRAKARAQAKVTTAPVIL